MENIFSPAVVDDREQLTSHVENISSYRAEHDTALSLKELVASDTILVVVQKLWYNGKVQLSELKKSPRDLWAVYLILCLDAFGK